MSGNSALWHVPRRPNATQPGVECPEPRGCPCGGAPAPHLLLLATGRCCSRVCLAFSIRLCLCATGLVTVVLFLPTPQRGIGIVMSGGIRVGRASGRLQLGHLRPRACAGEPRPQNVRRQDGRGANPSGTLSQHCLAAIWLNFHMRASTSVPWVWSHVGEGACALIGAPAGWGRMHGSPPSPLPGAPPKCQAPGPTAAGGWQAGPAWPITVRAGAPPSKHSIFAELWRTICFPWCDRRGQVFRGGHDDGPRSPLQRAQQLLLGGLPDGDQ